MKRIQWMLAVLMIGFCSTGVQAAEHVFNASLVSPMQIVDEKEDIKGLRLNLIYGKNRNVTGLDLGLVNHVTEDFQGVEFGFVNYVQGDFTGWQGSPWAASINLVEGNLKGLQMGVINAVKGNAVGLQAGWLMNWTAGDIQGAQLSMLYNQASHMKGLQLGFINRAATLNGVQIGLVNLNDSNDPFGFLPIVNWSF